MARPRAPESSITSDFDSRIAAGVEDFPRDHVLNGAHYFTPSASALVGHRLHQTSGCALGNWEARPLLFTRHDPRPGRPARASAAPIRGRSPVGAPRRPARRARRRPAAPSPRRPRRAWRRPPRRRGRPRRPHERGDPRRQVRPGFAGTEVRHPDGERLSLQLGGQQQRREIGRDALGHAGTTLLLPLDLLPVGADLALRWRRRRRRRRGGGGAPACRARRAPPRPG